MKNFIKHYKGTNYFKTVHKRINCKYFRRIKIYKESEDYKEWDLNLYDNEMELV